MSCKLRNFSCWPYSILFVLYAKGMYYYALFDVKCVLQLQVKIWINYKWTIKTLHTLELEGELKIVVICTFHFPIMLQNQKI